MIRLIFHQIWNQRRQNLWIWLELMVLSVFIWMVMDPLFTMVCIRRLPANFDREHAYVVSPVYAQSGPAYKAEADNDSCYKQQLDLLLTQLNAHPMTEAVCIIPDRWNFPGGGSWNGGYFYPSRAASEKAKDEGHGASGKSVSLSSQFFVGLYCEGLEQWSDMPYTLGLRDAATGELLHARPDDAKQGVCYISAKAARILYGTELAKDSSFYEPAGGVDMRVGGVYKDVKQQNYLIPAPSVILSKYDCWQTPKDFSVMVRLKPDVDAVAFEKAILKDVLLQCRIGNTLRFELFSVRKRAEQMAENMGANNLVRIHLALGGFGLLCVFLGVTGLFWVRCIGRRQDMGVMRSMGATRLGVVRQMLCESVLLFVMAFVPAMILVGIKVYLKGYNLDFWLNQSDTDFWFLRTVPHVSAVTLLSFLFMLIIILLATWIPVYHASKTMPSDALHDE